MARPNFFNENRNTTFPFRTGSAGIDTPAAGLFSMYQLPDDVVVDCGFVFGPESGFVEGEHTVFLYKVSRVSTVQINYEFRSDAPNLANFPLIFTRQVSDADYRTEFLESDIPEYTPASQSLSLSLSASQSNIVCGEPYWSGYMVSGSVSSVIARLSVAETVTRADTTETLVEPALIQNLNESQVVSINIANSDRTRALRPDNCPPNAWAFVTGQVYVNRECFQGALKFRAGYNISMNQLASSNTLQLYAGVNAGLGEPCAEIPLFPAESGPVGATNNLLAGDFYCNEVLRAVNGLQGPNFTIFAGAGVSVTADSVGNKVIIDVNLNALSLCTFSAVSESL